MTEQPAAPATAAEAAARLDILSADAAWSAKVLAGHGPAVREFQDLVAKKSGGDKLDQIIAGTAEVPPFETVMGGELSTHNQMLTAGDLRDVGLSDGAIRQVFENKPVSRAEYDAVKRLHGDRLKDADWTKKLLGGDKVAHRDLLLMQVVLNAGPEKEKAA